MGLDDVNILAGLKATLFDPELDRLRKELAEERELNRKLWVAAGKLRLAHGIAWAAMDGDEPEFDAMSHAGDSASEVLNGIIGLTVAEGEDDA